jgi:hypothetical protein
MLLVQLTELPIDDCEFNTKREIIRNLLSFKEAMLEPRVISTLMAHLADCL